MDPFREASYEQIARVINIIDYLKPIEDPGTGIPSIGFLERWVADEPSEDDLAAGGATEWTIRMWENAKPRKE
jgi:hypothetical protein